MVRIGTVGPRGRKQKDQALRLKLRDEDVQVPSPCIPSPGISIPRVPGYPGTAPGSDSSEIAPASLAPRKWRSHRNL
eukprot:1888626-Rhodomonas_salina.4